MAEYVESRLHDPGLQKKVTTELKKACTYLTGEKDNVKVLARQLEETKLSFQCTTFVDMAIPGIMGVIAYELKPRAICPVGIFTKQRFSKNNYTFRSSACARSRCYKTRNQRATILIDSPTVLFALRFSCKHASTLKLALLMFPHSSPSK